MKTKLLVKMKRALIGFSLVSILSVWHISRKNNKQCEKSMRLEAKATPTTQSNSVTENYASNFTSPNLKVLVMAINPRSGSSYLSEMLTLGTNAALFFEPLRYLHEEVPKNTNATISKLRRMKMRRRMNGPKKVKEFVSLR